MKRARAYQPSRWITASGSGRAAGARPWVAWAANELRASGRTRQQNDYASAGVLTPQEREIALMAASGMSNKQIGERLFLSHRTVGTHLYRAFPKLGIASRAALRDALTDAQPRRHILQRLGAPASGRTPA